MDEERMAPVGESEATEIPEPPEEKEQRASDLEKGVTEAPPGEKLSGDVEVEGGGEGDEDLGEDAEEKTPQDE